MPTTIAQTDKELAEKVAITIMGWHRGRPDRRAIQVPSEKSESGQWWYSRHGSVAAPAIDDSFANLVAWNPTQQWRDVMEVVAQMQLNLFDFQFELTHDGKVWAAFRAEQDAEWIGEEMMGCHAQRAICLAALAARESARNS